MIPYLIYQALNRPRLQQWAYQHFPADSNRKEMIQDALDDALLILLKKIRTGSFYAKTTDQVCRWLFVCARNIFLNMKYGKKKSIKLVYDVELAGMAVAADSTEKPGASAEMVREAVGGMTDPCRKYLQWHYLQRMPVAEMERLTGRSHKGIINQLYRCRIRLGEILVRHYGFPKTGLWN
jgi:DNA-directed RNA polymerase specialized sigma24 family protein